MIWQIVAKVLIGLLMDLVVSALIKFVLELCSAIYTNYCQTHKARLA